MNRRLIPALAGALVLGAPSLVLAAPSSPCLPPGEVVVTDPAGDTAHAEADLLEVAIAELHSGPHAGRIMVTLRAATLADGPSGLWSVTWEDPAGETRTTLSMSACAGAATYQVQYDAPEGAGSGPPAAASYAPSGTIELIVAREQIGSPASGEVFARIRASAIPYDEVLACLPVLNGNDLTSEGSYTLGACVVGVPVPPAHAALALGPAFPNPATRGVRLVLEVPAALDGATPAAAVFDAAGRRVRTLAAAVARPGPLALDWDLRDYTGLRVAPGTYWVRVGVAGIRRTRPVVVARH